MAESAFEPDLLCNEVLAPSETVQAKAEIQFAIVNPNPEIVQLKKKW